MISIITRNVQSDPNDNLATQIANETWNTKAYALASDLRKSVENKRCEKHPNANQTIFIQASKGAVQIERKFCCPEFEEAIVMNSRMA